MDPHQSDRGREFTTSRLPSNVAGSVSLTRKPLTHSKEPVRGSAVRKGEVGVGLGPWDRRTGGIRWVRIHLAAFALVNLQAINFPPTWSKTSLSRASL